MKYNKKQITTVLKPLIKECIKEVLFEEQGVLSNVISEVVKGIQTPILENMHTEVTDSPQGSPMSGVAPNDAGVDIDAIAKIANGKRKHLIK